MRGIYSLAALVVSGLTLLSSTVVDAKSATGSRVLVLLDSLAEKDSYSQFWQQLEDRQFQLLFKEAQDPTTTLTYFGESLFNHIIHFAPKSPKIGQHPALNNIQLIDFVKKGGNILAVSGVDASDSMHAFAAEFDIELDTDAVYGHTNYVDKHDKIATNEFVGPSSIIDATQINAPILYSGAGLRVGQLPLSTAIMAAESDAFLAESYDKSTKALDTVTLAGALQSLNSARVTFVGSIDVFSDDYLTAPVRIGSDKFFEKSGNEEFAKQLSQWTFQEKSVLKVIGHSHSKQNETEQLDWYRVKDDITYHVDISEYRDDHWVPFHANDIQLEIIMLDPYIRTTLKEVPTDTDYGRFEANIKLPDVYGVFTLRVNYKRAGLGYVLAEDQVSIRPFRHNEYPRFLTAAYPYYASTASMIIGFLVFSAVWLSTWGGGNSTASKVKAN
ncbi:Dolichyl-diphosphooligosaccharide--protein glycosyltransferase subunit WBP1 [Parasitella parasitica]|nr:Dolichyl-diphosphooligosaccharide--protein glycosyltransferase subunit WBP1 [Parasitella parasitica]